ncbi:nuclear transport factor 2 family protein [Cupriavidus necator]|uniref:nuclear transport factor 2 family protein n=1 Tax=Cupriavidus necator TaxID=106590 RepID=UPI0039C2C1CA
MTNTASGIAAAYLDAVSRQDLEQQLACFHADATVRDVGESKVLQGHDAIRAWSAGNASQYALRVEVRDSRCPAEGQVVVRTLVHGAFPGSPLPFTYDFMVRDGRIAQLVIEQP